MITDRILQEFRDQTSAHAVTENRLLSRTEHQEITDIGADYTSLPLNYGPKIGSRQLLEQIALLEELSVKYRSGAYAVNRINSNILNDRELFRTSISNHDERFPILKGLVWKWEKDITSKK